MVEAAAVAVGDDDAVGETGMGNGGDDATAAPSGVLG